MKGEKRREGGMSRGKRKRGRGRYQEIKGKRGREARGEREKEREYLLDHSQHTRWSQNKTSVPIGKGLTIHHRKSIQRKSNKEEECGEVEGGRGYTRFCICEDFDGRYSERPLVGLGLSWRHLWCLKRNSCTKEKKMSKGEERCPL